jgi:UPF0755 protein
MGTAFNWVCLAVTVFLVYTFMIKGYEYGETFATEAMAEKTDEEIVIIVTEGDTPSSVSKKLEEQGVVQNALLFQVENMFKGTDTNYKPGEYTLMPTMSSYEINAILRGGGQTDPDKKITILEGFSIDDIAEYLESNEIVEADKFLWAVDNHDYKYEFLQNIPKRERKLEGYLFPDTYFLSSAPTPDEIINKMLTRFEGIYYDSGYDIVAKNLGKSMDEIICVASMIEEEYRRADERNKGSAVIYNRLSQNLNLNVSATLVYALGKRRDRLTEEDLQFDSPYNTYNKPGLPNGPICNPGEACIQAALLPVEDMLLYSVLMDESSGEHLFFETEEEYLVGREQYNQVYN